MQLVFNVSPPTSVLHSMLHSRLFHSLVLQIVNEMPRNAGVILYITMAIVWSRRKGGHSVGYSITHTTAWHGKGNETSCPGHLNRKNRKNLSVGF